MAIVPLFYPRSPYKLTTNRVGIRVKKKIPIIIINALFLMAFFACLIVSGNIRNTLQSQQAAQAWAGQSGERFAQLSVFMPAGFTFAEEEIFNLRTAIDSALIEASLESTPEQTLYTDAWAVRDNVLVDGGRGSTTVQAYGVGGNFFLFHPLRLRDGSYFSQTDLMRDRIVLDEELAWRLFGSVRVAGLQVEVNGIPHTIAGVVARDTDFASSRAYTAGAGMFMSYESLRELTAGQAQISTYLIVMPDPITGFALAALTEAFPNNDAHIIENSTRYSLANIFAVVTSFGERGMRTDGIIYPYWENAARYTEDWLALLLVLMLVFIICPTVFGIIYSVKGIRYLLKRLIHHIKEKIEERDQREAKQYLLENMNIDADTEDTLPHGSHLNSNNL